MTSRPADRGTIRTMTLPTYESLGSFYLGRLHDLERGATTSDLLLYDSKDLVTHAVCVGMTGSGKTGLCIGLLEEAALDGIPSIIIDPKGDLANLLLTFPGLTPEDFEPWVNEDDAKRKNLTRTEFAAKQAEAWRKGLESWGQSGERIARLKSAAEFAVYTPGSNAARPVSVLKSFDAPPRAILDETELLRDRISTTTTSLLGLMGIQADPIQSREHILISNIFHAAWNAGRPLDLPSLIQSIQSPGFTRLGVMELETVFPAKDRFTLAMALNNLVASPGFASWMEGEPLDIASMLFTPNATPRVSIFSIAHLSDAERMFFVSLLLNETLAWVRSQSGTSSLRAILYMDEIAGYVPPVANPPSKQPLLTLMKQARAFGVGVVLATQNPVDLDYKGLSNAGTWFIGRLQTERDKARVLDGLEGAAATSGAGFDRAAADRALSSLTSRVFLMNNVHDREPAMFETRWVMSYLRGPMTRAELRRLSQTTAHSPSPSSVRQQAPSAAAPAPAAPPSKPVAPASRPVLPPEIPQFFLPARAAGEALTYKPMLLGSAKIHYSDAKHDIDTEVSLRMLAPIAPGPVPVDWDAAEPTDLTESCLEAQPGDASARYEPLPADAGRAKSFDAWKKAFADSLYRTQRLELHSAPALKIASNPDELERDFRARLQQAAREQRDAAADKLRARYAPKVQTLQDRLRRAEQAVEVQKEQASASKFSTAISFGAAVLGAFTGRKTVSAGNVGRAASAARSVSRSSKESKDVGRAEENADAIRRQLEELQQEFESEVQAMTAQLAASSDDIQSLVIKPKKTNISVRAVVLVWTPHLGDAPAWA